MKMSSYKKLMSNVPQTINAVYKPADKFEDEFERNYCEDYAVKKRKQKFIRKKPAHRKSFLKESKSKCDLYSADVTIIPKR